MNILHRKVGEIGRIVVKNPWEFPRGPFDSETGVFQSGLGECGGEVGIAGEGLIDLPHQVEVVHLGGLKIAESGVTGDLALELIELPFFVDLDGLPLGLLLSQLLEVAVVVGQQTLGLDVALKRVDAFLEFLGRGVVSNELAQLSGGLKDFIRRGHGGILSGTRRAGPTRVRRREINAKKDVTASESDHQVDHWNLGPKKRAAAGQGAPLLGKGVEIG